MAFKKKPGVDVAVMVKPHGKGPDLSGPGSLEPPEPGGTGDEQEPKPDADEGAITPEEVVVSIMADVIAAKRGRHPPHAVFLSKVLGGQSRTG